MKKLAHLLLPSMFSVLTAVSAFAAPVGLSQLLASKVLPSQKETVAEKLVKADASKEKSLKAELGVFDKQRVLSELKKQKISLPEKNRNKLESRGGMDSGGGAGLIDQEGNVQIMDMVEAKKEKIQYDFGPEESTTMEKVAYVLKRMATVAPVRAAIYIEWANTFQDEIEWLEAQEEINSPSNIASQVMPSGSKSVLIALQRTEDSVELGQKRYLVNGTLLAKLDKESQATLVLHEIVYRDLLSRENSKPTEVRYIVKKLIDRNFNLQTYNVLMGYQLFSQTEWQGFGPLDSVKSAKVAYSANFNFPNYSIPVKTIGDKTVAQAYGAYDKCGAISEMGFSFDLSKLEEQERFYQFLPELRNWHIDGGFPSNIAHVATRADTKIVDLRFLTLTHKTTKLKIGSFPEPLKFNHGIITTLMVPENTVTNYIKNRIETDVISASYMASDSKLTEVRLKMKANMGASFLFNNKVITVPSDLLEANRDNLAIFQIKNDSMCLAKIVLDPRFLKKGEAPLEHLFDNECVSFQ